MNQSEAVTVTRTEQIFIRDQESDCDDDDRRQLIIRYANDTYLSKWDAADNNEGKDDKSDITLTIKVPNINGKIDQEDSCQVESGHLRTSYDCDELSLVSYNSFRDGTSLAVPKTAPASLQSQLPFAGGKEELKLFQGYGGNIYFDAVRCKSMIINSTKSAHPRKQASSDNYKSNSRISSKRDVVDQVHTSCFSSPPTEAPTSIHALGSLRMRPVCKEKKWKPGESRHKDTKRHLSGKICKGFSEKLLTETFQKFYEKQGDSVAGKPMILSGGSVGHSTAVDSIGNNQIGFPALISNSSFFSHRGRQKSPEAVDSSDENPFMKLPFLKKYEGKKKTRKSDDKKLGEERKMVNEVSPVFIIPFGAFDDPVDFESQDVKRKVDHKEKASTIGDTGENRSYSALENRKGRFQEKSSKFDSVLVPARAENHANRDTAVCSDSGNIGKHPTPDPRATTLIKAVKPGSADLFVKREISNISLSNYLRAVPTRVSKETVQATSSQSYTKPKISYTKRSQSLSTLYMVNNTLHRPHHTAKASQKITASQLSGGYIPNTSGKECQLFYAEISTCVDGNSLKSDDHRPDSHRRSQCSGNFRKTVRSSQASKHALLTGSFTHQGPERASNIFDPVRNSRKKVFPITGQQISRLSGVQNR